MNKIDMYILAEFIDDEIMIDKLEIFLLYKGFTEQEIIVALEELGLN